MLMFAQSNKQITAFVAVFFFSFLSVKSSFCSDGLIFYANLYEKHTLPFQISLSGQTQGLAMAGKNLTERLSMVSLSSHANMRESAANILQN